MPNIFETLTNPGPSGRPSSSILFVAMTEIVDGTYTVEQLATKIGWTGDLAMQLATLAGDLASGITTMITARATSLTGIGMSLSDAQMFATEHVRAFIFARMSQVLWRCEQWGELNAVDVNDPLRITEAEFYAAFFSTAP